MMITSEKYGIRALILDMDGVLWRGEQLLGDLPAIFAEITKKGLKVLMASNNSTKSPAAYSNKIRSLGVPLEFWQLINSAEATADYLSQKFPQRGPVYVIGESGLMETLEAKGFEISEDKAIAVIAGLDRKIDYRKIDIAANLITQGALFIGSNPDRTIPTPTGFSPGAGTMLAAIEAASYVKPTIIGKPQPAIFELAMKRLGTKPEETLMVGDRLETDITGGQNIGCRTALVLSGVSNLAEGQAWQPKIDFIVDDLSALIKLL